MGEVWPYKVPTQSSTHCGDASVLDRIPSWPARLRTRPSLEFRVQVSKRVPSISLPTTRNIGGNLLSLWQTHFYPFLIHFCVCRYGLSADMDDRTMHEMYMYPFLRSIEVRRCTLGCLKDADISFWHVGRRFLCNVRVQSIQSDLVLPQRRSDRRQRDIEKGRISRYVRFNLFSSFFTCYGKGLNFLM